MHLRGVLPSELLNSLHLFTLPVEKPLLFSHFVTLAKVARNRFWYYIVFVTGYNNDLWMMPHFIFYIWSKVVYTCDAASEALSVRRLLWRSFLTFDLEARRYWVGKSHLEANSTVDGYLEEMTSRRELYKKLRIVQLSWFSVFVPQILSPFRSLRW